jgi:TRAP-type C4-dicarboxylate transport system substrate-binding protein
MTIYLGPYYLLMNKTALDALPADLQQIIFDHSTRDVSLEMAYVFEADVRRGKELVLEAGGQFLDVTDADRKEFMDKSEILITNWIDANSADGFDPEGFIQKTRDLATKYYIDADTLNSELDSMGF